MVYILKTKYIINMRLKESSFLNILKNLRLDQPSFRTARDYAALNMNYVVKIQDIQFLTAARKPGSFRIL